MLAAALSVALVMALAGCGGSSAAEDAVEAPPTTLSPAELLTATRGGVVRVRNTGCGELSMGTAWLTEDGRMISNRHVVEGSHLLELLTWDGVDLHATGASVSDSVDIGVLDGDWASVNGLTPLPVTTERVEPGERLTIIGYPNGEQLDVSSGVAVRYAADVDGTSAEILRSTAVVHPGNSGGPVLNTSGEVVGVVYAEWLDSDEALIVPWSEVAAGPADLKPETACR